MNISPDDQEWHLLKSEIERVIPLETISVRLGGKTFTWYRAADPDQLLEAALQSHQPAEEVDPFWAATWRAAMGLDRFLDRVDCRGLRVLELGCGSGQAGVGAAARGASVVMTDAVPIALQVARLNAWPVAANVQFCMLKWGDSKLKEPAFPLIIGSDLVYDPAHFPQLLLCAEQHLQPGGKLLLSEPQRHTGDRFAEWIALQSWSAIEHQVDLEDGRIAIRVFECSPPPGKLLNCEA